MKSFRRNFLKIISLSYLSTLLFPYNFLSAVTKKIINPNLTEKQKKIMFEGATERPYTSPLNQEKREGFFISLIVVQNYLLQLQSLIVELVGHPLQSHYPELLKLKSITLLE